MQRRNPRSRVYAVKWIYLEDESFDEYFETSLFVILFYSGLAHIFHDPLFIEDLQLEVVTSHLDRNF